MKDIKELAERIAKDFSSPDGENNEVIYSQHSPEFAQRLIAAYTEGQEPFAWGIEISGEPTDVWLNKDNLEREFNRRQDKYPDATRRFVPLYAAPPLTEPAPAVDPHWPKINMDISEKSAATTPEEAQEMVSELLAITETINRGHHAADHYDAIAISCAANLIERLAADVAKWQALTDDQAKLIEVITRRTEREDRLASRVPEGCVVVPKEPTEAMRAVIRNDHGAYGSEDALYSALIAAGEVK